MVPVCTVLLLLLGNHPSISLTFFHRDSDVRIGESLWDFG
jgi:hypothetical protein